MMNDLTGDRNVVLGCLAMGMSPAEIEQRYDEIVEFSGIGDFIDLPMSTYSSGMAARLKFAIASAKTHDILLVDEALATGDAEFRVRSERKIRDLRDQAGTVFLVSHSLDVVLRHLQPRDLAGQGRAPPGRPRRRGRGRLHQVHPARPH